MSKNTEIKFVGQLISLLDVYELLRNVKRTYSKNNRALEPSLFSGLP